MINPIDIDERRGCTSASNALPDSLCIGRHLAQRGCPRTDNQYSATGDRVHAALATGSAEGLTASERDTFERCLEIERKKLVEFFGEDAAKAKAFREIPGAPEKSRLWVVVKDSNGNVYEHSCRPDVFYRLLDRALIIEYKTLFGDVPESPRNLQLRDQQVIVRNTLLITGDIGVVVDQPHVEADPQICVYDNAASKVAEQQMYERVIASNQPDAPRTAGEVQCKYCLAKSRCKQYLDFSSALVPAMMSLCEIPMDMWRPEHRAAAAAALKPARDFLDMIEEFVKKGLETDPAFCPGWYLKPGNITEAIVDAEACFQRFVKLGGTPELFMQAVKITKGPLKTAVGVVTNKKGKALDTAMAQLLDGLTRSNQNAPSLKPEDS